MSSMKWTLPVGGTHVRVLDITTGSGDTQIYLWISFPGDFTLLTQTQADGVASGFKSAVEALSGVTACAMTLLDVSNMNTWSGSIALLEMDSSDWVSYEAIVYSTPTEDGDLSNVVLLAGSPGDGVLSGADISGLASGLETALAGLTGVTSCTVAQNTVIPGTV